MSRIIKRPKLIKEVIEKRLAKNEKRIQRIAEESFLLRQQLEQIAALKPKEPYVKPVEEATKDDAIN